MEISGSQSIAAPRQAVWDALNDPEVLKRCLPGCESVTMKAADDFRVVVTSSIGPLRARFNGSLRMTEIDAPRSVVLVFQGEGGAIGFGKGSSHVSLADVPGGCELKYTAKAEVGGKLAQIGSRLIDGVARKMSDDFFAALRKVLVPEPQVPEEKAADVVMATSIAGDSAPQAVRPGPSEPRFSRPPTWGTVGWAAATAFSTGVAMTAFAMSAMMALRH